MKPLLTKTKLDQLLEWLSTIFDPFVEEAQYLLVNTDAQKKEAIKKKEQELTSQLEQHNYVTMDPLSSKQSCLSSATVTESAAIEQQLKEMEQKYEFTINHERQKSQLALNKKDEYIEKLSKTHAYRLNSEIEKSTNNERELHKALQKINELRQSLTASQQSESEPFSSLIRGELIAPAKPFQATIGRVYVPDFFTAPKTLQKLKVVKIMAETYEKGLVSLEIQLNDGQKLKAGIFTTKKLEEYTFRDDFTYLEVIMSPDERCMQQIVFYHKDGSSETIGPQKAEGRKVRFELVKGQHLVGAEVLVSA